MIKLTDIDGKAFYLASAAIAQILPAGVSIQRFGIKALVLTFAGKQWAVQQMPEEIIDEMARKPLVEVTSLGDRARSFLNTETGETTEAPWEAT